MKPVRFMGSAKDDLAAFPRPARMRAGHALFMVQLGREPDDWKPMATVGPGAREIRVRDREGAFRVIYVASFEDAVYVLHAFQKKSRETSQADLALARRRYADARHLARGAGRG
ncbi:MAG: type II toxin-antitoxin system RelE/ParE family toxin [Betaproteobacteria bacterium]|nr:type II toxin-antitoxin system RelE/ParE family toxin [Betaproteobacteria bacterium]